MITVSIKAIGNSQHMYWAHRNAEFTALAIILVNDYFSKHVPPSIRQIHIPMAAV
jgi:hypothetical protein